MTRAAAPFTSEHAIRRALTGNGELPDASARAEWNTIFGTYGEGSIESWPPYEHVWRKLAAERGITPPFWGRFYYLEIICRGFQSAADEVRRRW